MNVSLASLRDLLPVLDTLERSARPSIEGALTLPQVLVHCAQSIECSMDGYPQHRAALFRATLGRVALAKFLRAGRMSHDLDASIPGVPDPDASLTLPEAIGRLRAAVERFSAHKGAFAPHFAYGPVTAEQYDRVHAMHVANHLARVTV
jgi:hypothetical protein